MANLMELFVKIAAQDGASKVIKGVSNTAKTAMKGAAVAVGAFSTALAAGTTGAYKLAVASAKNSDEIDKMSQKIGISREAYQELDYVLSQNGMDVNSLQAGIKSLTNKMQSAQEGTKSAVATFESLGIAVTDSSGALRSQEDVFFDTIAKLQSMENITERNALANDLLGKSATELAPLLNSGAGSMEELRNKAHDLGLVLSDETIDAGVKFTDSIDSIKRSVESITTELGAEFMPIFQDAFDYIVTNMPEIREKVGKGFERIREAVENVQEKLSTAKEKFEEVKSYLSETFAPILTDLETAWNAVKDAIQPLIDKMTEYFTSGEASRNTTELLKTAVENLVNGYLALKDLVSDVVKGFKNAKEWAEDNSTALEVLASVIGVLTTAIVAYNIVEAARHAGGLLAIADNIAITAGYYALVAAETVATAATSAFGAVMAFVTSPVTLVVAAIAALIAIIVLCVKHWDDIKAAASSAWDGIKNVWATVSDWFDAHVIQPIADLFNGIWDTISGIAQKIASVFDFNWSLPPLKMPHFTVSGKFSLNPISVPTLGISWYRKAYDNPMLLNSPTIFGAAGGNLLGGGDGNGAEMVAGADTIMKMIREAVGDAKGNNIVLNVYGAEGQDVDALADRVMMRLQSAVDRKGAVWA